VLEQIEDEEPSVKQERLKPILVKFSQKSKKKSSEDKEKLKITKKRFFIFPVFFSLFINQDMMKMKVRLG
jgi:hypothetical protein